jgi:hypothetical protein
MRATDVARQATDAARRATPVGRRATGFAARPTGVAALAKGMGAVRMVGTRASAARWAAPICVAEVPTAVGARAMPLAGPVKGVARPAICAGRAATRMSGAAIPTKDAARYVAEPATCMGALPCAEIALRSMSQRQPHASQAPLRALLGQPRARWGPPQAWDTFSVPWNAPRVLGSDRREPGSAS